MRHLKVGDVVPVIPIGSDEIRNDGNSSKKSYTTIVDDYRVTKIENSLFTWGDFLNLKRNETMNILLV